MTQPSLVIWGASGHAAVVADIIRQQKRYTVTGFLDDRDPARHRTEFCGSRVLGGREQLTRLQAGGVQYLIFGFGNCQARLHLTEWVKSKGFLLATAVHPQAIVASDVIIGSGVVVAAGAIINPGSILGESVIVNTGAIVEHHCRIEAGAHIGPGTCLGGQVNVGQGTWVGLGATIKDHINIGARSVIGTGAVVVRDIPSAVMAYGVPARVIKKLSEHEQF